MAFNLDEFVKANQEVVKNAASYSNIEPKIKNDIKGKSYDAAIETLEKVEKIGGVRIAPLKKLPLLGKRLPYLSQNIIIVLISK